MNKNVNEFRKMTFEEFKQLVEFLSGIAEKQIQGEIVGVEEKNERVLALISRFLPDLTAKQELGLNHVIQTMDEHEFELFQNEYPDIHVDPTGRGQRKKKQYWELTLEAMDNLYKSALEDSNPTAIQVLNAKDLKCFYDKKYTGGVVTRKFLLEKMPQVFPEFRIKVVEKFLKEEFAQQPGYAGCFLSQIFGYCYERRKKPNSFAVMMDHLWRRLECLMFEKNGTGEIKNASNVQFFENITDLIETIIYK